MGAGRVIGSAFMGLRDAIARGLLAAGVSPNALTITGTLLTVGAGALLAMGAGDRLTGAGPWGELLARLDPPTVGLSYWNLLAGGLLILCGATDVLDGAVARLGNRATTFGAFLDSTLDRVSDFAIFAGIGLYYAWRANATYTLLAMVCIVNAFLISYTRARAETLIPRCRGGYWQRGERIAFVLVALFAYNVPALLWQQALLPAFTVWARIHHTWRVTQGLPVVEDPREGTWWDRIQPWRYPRMSWPYDLVTLANALFLVLAPIPQIDLLRLAVGG